MFTQISVNLQDLLLDPNNPRCVTDLDIKERVKDEDVEKHQENLLGAFDETGKSEFFSIKSLIDSFLEVGYVPIDKIVLKKLPSEKFLVLEGNRRISALKILEKKHQSGSCALEPELLKAMTALPAMQLETNGLSIEEINHRVSVLLGIRHHGSLLEWEPLPKSYSIFQTYKEIDPPQVKFEALQARIKDVAGSLSIRNADVKKGLRTFVAFNQLKEALSGVKDKHFSLVQAAIINPKLGINGFINADKLTYLLDDESIQNMETACQFDIRDKLEPAQKVIPKPQTFALLGRLVEMTKIAEHESIAAMAKKGLVEALSGELDTESQELKTSVQSALDCVIDLESRTKWLEELSKLLELQSEELDPNQFRQEGNEKMALDQLEDAILNLKLILGFNLQTDLN